MHLTPLRANGADLTALSCFTAFDIAVRTMPVPPHTGTSFKAYAEPWELAKDKRQRRGQAWRMRYKYVGMVMDDDDGLHRVIGVKWHKENEVNAGWVLETQRADSHTDRVMHHALQVAEEADEDGNDVYNIFESFKPEHNRHRPFESKDGSVVAAGGGEEEG